MATHSRILAWRIPGTEEPSELPSRVAQSRTQLKHLSSSRRGRERGMTIQGSSQFVDSVHPLKGVWFVMPQSIYSSDIKDH